MQRQIVQTTFRDTTVMDVAQTVHLFGQTDRAVIQLRKEILHFGSIRIHVAQVRTQMRIIEIRQTYRRNIAF